jgi:dCTP diphosphatase
MVGDNMLDSLAARLRLFAAERDWDQFHSPKNLAAAMSVEAAEVLEHFQWLTDTQSTNLTEEAKSRVALELADVLLYLIRLADKLEINLGESAVRKLAINEAKYPVDRAKGTAAKYTEL